MTSFNQPIFGHPLSIQEMQQASKFHGAAVLIQKHIRGQLGRKNAKKNIQAYLFFKKVKRIFNVR